MSQYADTRPVTAVPYPPAGGYSVPARPYQPYPYQPYPYPKSRNTSGHAIASLLVSIHALGVPGLGVVGAILGHIARRKIAETGDDGDGMALAGIIVGWVVTGLQALVIALYVVAIVLAVSHS